MLSRDCFVQVMEQNGKLKIHKRHFYLPLMKISEYSVSKINLPALPLYVLQFLHESQAVLFLLYRKCRQSLQESS